MAQAKQGDTVQVHYTGKLEDGTVFDTSRERRPLQFTIGKGALIVGVEEAVVGMSVGGTKKAIIPVEKAYGPRRPDLIVKLDRSQLPPDMNPAIGQRLELTQANDQLILVTVSEITPWHVTVDANHPLAGKVLTFELELVAIL